MGFLEEAVSSRMAQTPSACVETLWRMFKILGFVQDLFKICSRFIHDLSDLVENVIV